MHEEYHIKVTHGSLTVNVPRSLFNGNEATPNQEKVREFRAMLQQRYPWLSENSMNVFMKNAQKIMIETIDRETKGKVRSKKLIAEGRTEEAIKHIRRHLEQDPNDADSWYLLGEALCNVGRIEEGYAAMRKGRKLF